MAAFERSQQAALEKEQHDAELVRLAALKVAEEHAAELARQKRIAEKRRAEKELAEGLLAAAEAAMAKKEQEELARLRRKAEARRKEIEHARLLAEKKAKLKAEAEIKQKMAELERQHAEEVARVQREQEMESQRRKKQQEDAANAAARAAELAAREAQHAKEMAQLKKQMEEKAELERLGEQRLAESHAAAEAEMAALAAAEAAARDRAERNAQAEKERRREEEEKRAKEEEEAQEKKELAEKEALRVAELAKAQEAKKSQRKLDLVEAKKRKLQELEAAKLAAKAQEEERNKKNMTALVTKAQTESCCTYKLTEQQLVYQEYYSCSTCGDQKMGGGCFCFQCAENCHAGHDIKKAGAAPSFCDCGHDRATCLMMKSPSERKALQAKSKVTPDQAVTESTSDRSMDDSAEHPYIQILKDCKSSGRSWSDPDFPHDDSSIFGHGEVLHPDWVGTKWLRIKDIVKEPTIFLPPIDANDIRQGSLGNCWFMSACAVLTQKPEALMAVFVTREYNEQGVYGLRFFKNGKVANVTVDDWLPIQQYGPQHIDTLFAKPKDAKAIWVMLIEKAFAKLHHSYQNIEGGWIDDALVDLAGGVADRIRWTDEKTKTAIHDGSLWTMLLKYHSSGFLLGCGSPVGASDSEADASPFGIVQSHAYSILNLVAVDGIQLIQVRNPWSVIPCKRNRVQMHPGRREKPLRCTIQLWPSVPLHVWRDRKRHPVSCVYVCSLVSVLTHSRCAGRLSILGGVSSGPVTGVMTLPFGLVVCNRR